MNELSKLNSSCIAMTTKEIADRTGKRHDNVFRDAETMFNELGEDPLKFEGIYKDSYNRNQNCYILNKELTLTLISGYSIKMRKAIIDRWQEVENAGYQLARALESSDPRVLRKMADLAESKQVLEVENKNLVKRQAVIETNLESTKQELSAIKPMAEYGEKIFVSENLYTPTNIASQLGMRSTKAFNNLLKDKGVIKKGTGSADYAICAKYSGKGLTKYKHQTITHNSGTVETKMTLRWTRKGFDWLLEQMPKYLHKKGA